MSVKSARFNKRAILIFVAVIAAIALVGGSLAWFVTQSSLVQRFSISGIKAGAEVYFDNGSGKINAEKYLDKDGLYALSLDSSADNYIGNLRANVTLSGKAAVRTMINLEWTNADGSVSQYTSAVPFEFAEDWYDNRGTDYCIYYMGKDLSGKADFGKTELITGFDSNKFDTFGFDEGTAVRASIRVEAVQVNRYIQIWDIEKLPWK